LKKIPYQIEQASRDGCHERQKQNEGVTQKGKVARNDKVKKSQPVSLAKGTGENL
jgi:hypothetical protein